MAKESVAERIKRQSQQNAEGQEAAAAAVGQHVDSLFGAGGDQSEGDQTIEPVAAKPIDSRPGAKAKKKALPKYEPKDEAGKVPIPVYLRPSLAEKLDDHRWQGRWKSRTALIEHIIEEYYKNYE